MDPISIAFAAYLQAVSADVDDTVVDVMGAEVRALTISYDGLDIPFQYSGWQVRDASVCADLKSNLDAYSACTVRAKSLFTALCQSLSESSERHWKFARTKTMYCNAALGFQPTIAHISRASEESPLEAAKRACNVAVARTIGATDPASLAERERGCEAYQKLK